MGDEIRYYRRFHGYDYAKGASLFITMATDPRASVFGCVRDARVVRSELGEKSGLGAANRVQLQRLGAAMRRFKTFTTTLARRQLGRAACLALNDEIVKIACAGEGVGVCWREERACRITPDGAGESGQRETGAHGATCDVKSRGLGPA